MSFNKIDLEGQPMDLDLTLSCGQAFRWRKREDGVWYGVVGSRLLEVDYKDGCLLWKTYPEDDPNLVSSYFRLSDDVISIYEYLSNKCVYLDEAIQRFPGMRLLRQDPTEALLSFVCSAANSIPRIMASIEAMCVKFGEPVCEHNNMCYYAFPTTDALQHADEDSLWNSGSLAFRARNIRQVAKYLATKDPQWLNDLRSIDYDQAKAELVSIKGVGQKIADCVCLFSLDKDDAVPVDTHIRQIVCRLFLQDMQAKCVTDSVYRKIREEFTKRYAPYSGWAQQFLFYDDLIH